MFFCLNICLKSCSTLAIAAYDNFTISDWNKDWMPGAYPKNPQERALAAKKYGMRPEDYEPYPAEEGYGDYPKLPAIGAESKDYYNNYDMAMYKRNYGEPVSKTETSSLNII